MSSGRINRKKMPTVTITDHTKAKNPRIRKVHKPEVPQMPQRKRVLNKLLNHPILGFAIQFTPKPVRIMLLWLQERFKEPSTYQGLTTFGAVLGYSMSPEAWELTASVALGLLGLIQMMKKEEKIIAKTKK